MKTDLFIGPCVIESYEVLCEIAEGLKSELSGLEDELDIHFKASFDKANRSSIDSFRGVGLDDGLKLLSQIRDEYGYKLITDFHHPEQADPVAKVVDVIQIPAFLCRQTDMIVAGAKACAKYNRRLKIKKGQFLAPEDTKNIVEKAKNYIPLESILLTERGTSFGYQNLIVDMASFQTMNSFGVKTIHDATHCVQKPGAAGKATGGKRDQIEVLAKAAMAAGADGLFMEVHPRPNESKSDAATILPLEGVGTLIKKLLEIKKVARS